MIEYGGRNLSADSAGLLSANFLFFFHEIKYQARVGRKEGQGLFILILIFFFYKKKKEEHRGKSTMSLLKLVLLGGGGVGMYPFPRYFCVNITIPATFFFTYLRQIGSYHPIRTTYIRIGIRSNH